MEKKHFYPYVQLHSHESFRLKHRTTYLKFIAHHAYECSLDTKVPDYIQSLCFLLHFDYDQRVDAIQVYSEFHLEFQLSQALS